MATWSLCVLLLCSTFLVRLSGANVAGCGDCGWILHGSACYWISSDVDSLLIWDDAKDVCERRQATLASVNTDNHAFFIDEMDRRGRMHWLGFYKPNSQNTFEYLDGSEEDPYLTFRDGDRAKPSVEKKSEDCAGIAYTDTISDIWWEDEKCNRANYYICMKHAVHNITTITVKTTAAAATTTTTTPAMTATTTTMTTTESFTKMAVLSIGNYKPKKSRTAPPTSDPVSVISGTSAIVIIISVIAFIVGNDITGIFCRVKLCDSNQRFMYEPTVLKDETTHVISFTLEQKDSPKEIDLFIQFKNHYCQAVKPNGKLMKTKNLDAAYLVQNGSNIEIWVKHMSITTSKNTSGLATDRDHLDFETILLDHVIKSQSPGKYVRSHSPCSSLCQSEVDHEKDMNPVIGSSCASSPVSVTSLTRNGRRDTCTNPRRVASGDTYKSTKENRTQLEESAPSGKPLINVLIPDTKEPVHGDFVSPKSSSRSNIYSGRKFRKPPEVLSETPVATYMGSIKTKPKHSQKISATYLGSFKINPVKESSSESGFGDDLNF